MATVRARVVEAVRDAERAERPVTARLGTARAPELLEPGYALLSTPRALGLVREPAGGAELLAGADQTLVYLLDSMAKRSSTTVDMSRGSGSRG